ESLPDARCISRCPGSPHASETGGPADRNPVERLAHYARRGREGSRAEAAARCGALGRGGRRLQAAPQGLSTRPRPARGPCRRYRVPIVERLGRLRGLGIRDAGRMVQSLRATAGAIAGRARPDGEIAGGTPGPGWSVIDMNDGAVRMSCDAQLAEGGAEEETR